MKVIQLNVTYGNADSTGRNVKELHNYLLERGFDSHVYTTEINDESELDDRIHLFSSANDKRIHALFSRLTGKQGYFSYFSTKVLIAELSELKPDVVVLHVLHSNCINLPFFVKYLSVNHIPVVLVLHDCWYFTGHCCHYSEVKCEKWKMDCQGCPQIHEWNKSWFFDTADKCLKDKKDWIHSISKLGVIGVSNWITDEAKKSILKDADVIHRIYNWIDLEIFKPRDAKDLRKQLGISPSTKVLLGVASGWSNKKGLREMFRAAQNIPDAMIIMVGDMPKGISMPENMIAAGRITDPVKLSEFYSMADVFLNPSIQETFGKTTAEALSCGTPVIVYNTTACTELVGDSCGKVVPNGDTSLFIQNIICQLAENSEYVSDRCRKFAVYNFDAKARMRDYENVLRKIVEMS